MFTEKVIELVTTDWVALVLFVPKKDGSSCFCDDYQKLNAVTTHDSYQLFLMDECVDSFGKVIAFSTLEANSGDWQIEIDERGCSK